MKVFLIALVTLVACNKREPQPARMSNPPASPPDCGQLIITDKPVRVEETEFPIGTNICISPGELEAKITLPNNYAFLPTDEAAKTLPIYATYACYCSNLNSVCKVFYSDAMGFGCLQSSCTGSCTGKFTYKGYTVDKIISTASKEEFLKLPEIQNKISKIKDRGYHKLYGVSFCIIRREAIGLPKPTCDCEGTTACKLKSFSIGTSKIYFCEGNCNGCELTVN